MLRRANDNRHIADLLPAYARLTLPDAETRLVEAHLDGCADCRAAFDRELEELSDRALPAVAAPRSDARAAFLARTGGLRIVTADGRFDDEPVLAFPTAAGADSAPRVGGRADRPWAMARIPMAARVVAAVLLALVVPATGWALDQRAQSEERSLITALLNDPSAVYTLDDSELPVAVYGVFYANPDETTAYLVAKGLPMLPDDQRYQVWLVTPEEQKVSAGFLTVTPTGEAQILLEAPAPIGEYVAAAVTVEPETGSPTPNGTLTLGGWISA